MVIEETTLLRWIVFLPLLSAVVNGTMIGVVRRPTPRWGVIGLSCGAVLLSFVLSCTAFYTLVSLDGELRLLHDRLYTWIGVGIGARRLTADLAFQFDALSAVLCLVVTGVGSLIHLYSIAYMEDDHRDDRGFQRFFCYLSLFTFSMLVLVLADNLVLLFVGWEGVGLCSYLLIGFWYGDRENAYAGSKAFLVNRIGDFGFLIGIFLLWTAFVEAGAPAGVSFAEIALHFERIQDVTLAAPLGLFGESWRLVDVVGLCFLLGAVGKSAQLPLYVWLPDAMAGPTPVSALIHAATMVTAGIYLVCRLSFLYAAAPVASATIAWVGGATALFAATIAVAQTDIKKVLAYSTVSQLGYMFLAAGCGAYVGAIFHLVTHAFFKALLFLAAGSVILAMHHEQDVRQMGALRGRMPFTHAVFLIGVLAITGVPLTSGFFSKDEILVSAFAATAVPGHLWLYGLGIVTAVLTSLYMFRLYYLVFRGDSRLADNLRDKVREQPSGIVNPLWVLAGLALVGGLLGIPQAYADLLPFAVEDSHSLYNFLSPVLVGEGHGLDHATEYLLAGAAITATLLGFLLARMTYRRGLANGERVARWFAWPHRLLERKYFVDELYDVALVRPLVWLSDRFLFRQVDARWIDAGLVDGSARAVRGFAHTALRRFQSGLSQSYLASMLIGAAAILWWVSR
ncbi:MAG: NADH-quinone oxidoreductase subunit L [Myxococcota bacterium]